MSTTYNHIRMSTIDSNNNIAILYPESTSSDILVSRINNTNIPNNVSNIQLLANSLANSAFNNIINDNTTSINYTWSSYKINNKVSNINFYVDSNDSKLHFINSDNEDNVIDYTSGSGTATADKVLQGYTFSNNSGVNIPGTMLNQGTKEYTIDPGNTQTIPEGYHNGNGTISVNNISKDNTYTMLDSEYNNTIDLGINNTYRYVNATNVYNKGLSEGGGVHTGTYTLTNTGTTDLGINHTYRYISTGNLVLKSDKLLAVVGNGYQANISGYYILNNVLFICMRITNDTITLMPSDSFYLYISRVTWDRACSARFNVTFAAGTLTDSIKTVENCKIPEYADLDNLTYAKTYYHNSSIWTSTTWNDNRYAYYWNGNSQGWSWYSKTSGGQYPYPYIEVPYFVR